MPNKGHNLKKPKLAHPSVAPADATLPGLEPEKRHLTFAQHQHGLQAAEPVKAVDQQEPARQQMKSDAQQHQQKSGSHR